MSARERFAEARVARLATADADGTPHVVPLVFTLFAETLYTCVDEKPKTTRHLKRLRNIAARPQVSVLVDHYDDNWAQLWWVRVDGDASILTPAEPVDAAAEEARRAVDLLADKYPRYRRERPRGPVVAVRNLRWHAWSAHGDL
ncbi:TIGR03668 family PPOX class F420-dependent oxidoreductase [Rhodococcus triatomae]|uniref:PPOX class probable F420-dependent enzyme, Rv0121 family n=1 Tax=Rhodococcus triatomae TaxID=300028 RepID=A0A1G8QG16_9NOCA|nr:TIGR03668 family PPOX class F420-dependent oxidoreductase [Rhodococcus triatomae]QNG20679.1 TIGR03668 family PPOX class F420-dependent oxidoreductase [Rhodococcus triatomae]QNG23403.1 TIGR03668 family PPOX class F420-dependent oxidoreductase [Rhodococcus triatomae]SDJ03739.1 PPOX class probable F420-dependent enzyme, Rv0121 family [Rhodococcus triatomae]